MPSVKITLCLGSSCHARGNRHHVETLKGRLNARGIWAEFELKGSLCLGRCSEGPVVLIDGVSLALGPDEDLVQLVVERLSQVAL